MVAGIIGNTAIHLRKDGLTDEKAPKIHELYVDVGASSAGQVKKLGIRVGHPAVYADAAEEFGEGRVVGRALDNRLGGFILAQVMARLSKRQPRSTVIAVNATDDTLVIRVKPDNVKLQVTRAAITSLVTKPGQAV